MSERGSYNIINKEKAIKKINEINPNYTLLSEFKGWREDVLRKCNTCGDIRTVNARSLIEKNNGQLRKCPVCAAIERAKSYKKTHGQFLEELKTINNDIEILSEYITNSKKVKCICLIDGFEWETAPHVLLQGHGCPECSRKNQNWRNEEQFIEELHNKYPTITPSSKFTRVNDSMKFKCKTCGYEWNTAPNVLLNNENYCGCPKCSGYGRVFEQDIINRLEENNPRVQYISGYKGILYRAKFKCNICDNEWETPVNSVLSGRGCPKCNMSHGALEIEKTLKELGIDYETEYRFDECKDKRSLPFDFYIESKNICIEYDGEQHFMPVRFGKTQTETQIQQKFDSCQHRDKIKSNYCENNGIKLIRIPYTEFNNIEEILNKYLS